MKPFSILITFQSDEDAKYFLDYKSKADKQDGTVTGLYAGLMCSALRRARLANPKVIKTAIEALEFVDRAWSVGDPAPDTPAGKIRHALTNLSNSVE